MATKNHRSEERVPTTLPVKLGNKMGLTRDISVSGICFDIDADYVAGSEITFEVELDSGAEKIVLKCRGSIVRTDTHGQKRGVAVKITESVLQAAP